MENKGFILFHHGYGSHTGVYHSGERCSKRSPTRHMTQVARIAAKHNSVGLAAYQAWAAQGMTVVAHDSQGHGRSKGDDPKLHVWMDSFDHWVNDIYQIRKVNKCFTMYSMFCIADIDSVNIVRVAVTANTGSTASGFDASLHALCLVSLSLLRFMAYAQHLLQVSQSHKSSAT